MADSSQKFIARNRAPRVQIEYDVELYGAEKKVQLPFVMGVMADLTGKSKVPQPSVADRTFLEIDVDNFDARMKALAPRAAFSVPNTLTGEGNLSVDLTFESMKDFSPGAIAAKVDALRPLLEARTQLQNLMAYMDGKSGAEALIEKILRTPSLLAAVSASEPSADTETALESLRGIDLPEEAADESSSILSDLAGQAPVEAKTEDGSEGVLDSLRGQAPEEKDEADATSGILEGLATGEPAAEQAEDETADVLKDLAGSEPSQDPGADTVTDVLAGIASTAPAAEDAGPDIDDVLGGIEATDTATPPEKDDAAQVLQGLSQSPVEEEETQDDLSAALDSLPETEDSDAPDTALAALDSLTAIEPEDTAEDDVGDILGGLASAEETDPDSDEEEALKALDTLTTAAPPPEQEETEDMLADILGSVPEDTSDAEEETAQAEALSSLASIEVSDSGAPEDDVAALLEGLAEPETDAVEEADTTEDALQSLAEVETGDSEEDDSDLDDILGGISEEEPTGGNDTDEGGADDILSDLGLSDSHDDEEAEGEDTAQVAALSSLTLVEVSETEAPEDDVAALLEGLAEPETDAAEASDTAEDALNSLAEVETGDSEEADPDLDDILGGISEEDRVGDDDADEGDADDILSDLGLSDEAEETAAEDSDLDDLLGDLTADEEPEGQADQMQEEDDLAALLQDATEVQEPDDAPDDDLAALLADDDEEVSEAEPSDADFDLDALLADETSDDSDEAEEAAEEAAGDDLDDLLSGFEEDASDDADEDDLDSLLAGLGDEASEEKEPDEITDEAENSDDLDALLTDLDDPGDDLDALLAGEETADTADDDDLDDLLAGLASEDEDAGGDDLDDLLGDLTADETAKEEVAPPAAAEAEADKDPEFAFGTLSADRPEPQKLVRKRFRMALFGDFSGRAARGIVETGDALAARKAVLLDPDTVEDVIESFATELVLPIGKDGAGIAVKLGTLDDLHPDELFENVALFSELVGLRKQLQSGATADHAAATLRAWAEKHGTRAHAPKTRSAGSSVPADRRLSAFQQLIGDTGNALRQASPVEEMLARIVGPHIRALPDPDVAAMQVAVDEALSDAMRLVLHHPEFQSVEAQWRALDLIARSVEVDDSLEVMLYDVSAEELAADLAAADDLTQSGFARLLTEEPLDEENGRGGYSALIGLYGFEETPPHAELLGRIARVAAHVDAPFFAAMSPAFLAVPKKERPKLVAEAWDTLQGMSEAGHLGLVSPRFLLRRPYGAKSDPIYEFDFEEFTEAEGLRGMLWANPVVLVAILLARSFKANGAAMQLGSIMSLGGMPYHYVNDRFGDQVALPCTERNIDLDKIAMANERGFMAIAAVKGRDELRLTSFQSVKGGEILGPWTGLPAPEPSPPDPRKAASAAGGEDIAPGSDGGDDDDLNLDDLGLEDLDLDTGGDDGGDLDDLLASFEDIDEDSGDDDGMDADLAALLDDL